MTDVPQLPPQEPAASGSPIVEMSHVQLAFGQKVILNDLNLSVAPRERLVIMGQSGGGKSTTLRLIMGILHPNAGSVKFKGEEVTRMTRPRLNRMTSCPAAPRPSRQRR